MGLASGVYKVYRFKLFMVITFWFNTLNVVNVMHEPIKLFRSFSLCLLRMYVGLTMTAKHKTFLTTLKIYLITERYVFSIYLPIPTDLTHRYIRLLSG